MAETREQQNARKKRERHKRNENPENRRIYEEKYTKYNQDNAEKQRDYARNSRATEPERQRAADHRHYWKDPELSRAKDREYYRHHADASARQGAAWRKANPEKVREYTRARRSLVEGNGGEILPESWQEKLEYFDHSCVYCGTEATTLDHVEPISKGGLHHIDNAVPACKRCNSSKRDKSLSKWLAVSKIAQQALVNYPESMLKTIIPNKNS